MFNKLSYHYQTKHYYFPLMVAFLLPLSFPIPLIIALWIIAFFSFNTNIKDIAKKVFQNKWLYVYWSFFWLHTLGYFFSNNKTEALTGIETKLTFFILPFLVFGVEYKLDEFKKIKKAFVLSSLFLLLFCVLRAIYLLITQKAYFFFYSDFTFFIHPSYFAMYLLFSIMILLIEGNLWVRNNMQVINTLLIGVFLIGVFLASSKMGIISTLILFPVALAFKLYQLGYKKTIVAVFISTILTVVFLYQLFPNKFERFNNAFSVTTSNKQIDLTSTESTAVRVLIWDEAVDIIKQNCLLGTTVGDANDELYKAYRKKGLTGALEKKLNAHNQYLQTFIGTGILGFTLLLLLTFGMGVFAFFKKHYLLLCFSVIITLNFLVESMLQAQVGFLFFVFFSCLLINSTFSNEASKIIASKT